MSSTGTAVAECAEWSAGLPPVPLLGSTIARVWIPSFLLLILAVLGVLLWDLPLARIAKGSHPPGWLGELFDIAEPLSNGLGIVLIAYLIATLDRRHGGGLVRVLVLGLGSGLAANVLKLMVARTRPRSFDLALNDAWATFGPWVPDLARSSGQQSFPSAHTASAIGLAVALSSLYPQGRRLFFALLILVPLSRVGGAAHFFSDVCCGAALGWLFSAACLHVPRMARLLNWLEERCQRWLSRPPARTVDHSQLGAQTNSVGSTRHAA